MKNILYIILALATVSLNAQNIPQGFNYQAVARDASNQPFTDQDIAIEISIISDINGNRVYAETHNVQTSELGIFNVVIGEGQTVQGDFTTIDWGAEQYLIRTRIDPDGGTDWITVGQSRLLSVPYALYAATGGGGGTGQPINIRGTVGTSAALPATGMLGELWIVGDTGNGWVWEESSSSWRDIGPFRGPRGQDGSDGRDGVDGQDGQDGRDGTSIRIAGTVATQGDLDNNYSGSVGDLIITLDTGDGYVWNGSSFDFIGEIRGPKGEDGVDGQDGRDGIDGQDGMDGRDGVDGRDGIDGQDGTSVKIVGTEATQADLDPNYMGEIGDLVVTLDTGDGYVWNGSSWDFLGEIRGPQGDKGDQGDMGDAGPTGPTGPRGMDGFSQAWVYNISTADNGQFTTNSSTLSAVSTVTVHRRSSEGNTIDSWLGSYNIGDQLFLREDDDLNTFAFYDITNVSTSGNTHTYNLAYIEGDGSLSVDTFLLGFARQGPQGQRGQPGQDGTDGTNGLDGDTKWTTTGNDIFNNNTGSVNVEAVTFTDATLSTQTGIPLNVNGVSIPNGGIDPYLDLNDLSVRIGNLGPAANGVIKYDSDDLFGHVDGQWKSLTDGGSLWSQNPTSQAVYFNDGNVGIGTSNPIDDLAINKPGTASLYLRSSTSGDGMTLVTGGSVGPAVVADGSLSVAVDGTVRAVFTDDGKLGVGTNSPTGDIEINSSPASSIFLDSGSGPFRILHGNGRGAIASNNEPVIINNDSGTNSNDFVLDVTDNVGIGLSNPSEKLDVVGAIKSSLDILAGDDLVASDDVFVGDRLTFDGGSGAYLTGSVPVGAIFSSGDILPISTNSNRLGSSGFRWSGVWASGGFINSSDMRLKTHIRSLDEGLEVVMKLRPKRYEWKNPTSSQSEDIGFLAQDLLEVVPEVVVTHEEVTNGQGVTELKPVESLGVKYHALIPVLTAAIQEQQVIIESQEEQLTSLQSEVAELRRIVTQALQAKE